MAFDSEEAAQLNRDIFECIYYASLKTSCEQVRPRFSGIVAGFDLNVRLVTAQSQLRAGAAAARDGSQLFRSRLCTPIMALPAESAAAFVAFVIDLLLTYPLWPCPRAPQAKVDGPHRLPQCLLN